MHKRNEEKTNLCRNVTWAEFEDACNKISAELKDFSPEWIIGISRGGLPLAVALSHRLKCRNVGVTIAVKGQKMISHKHIDSYYSIIGTVTPLNKPNRILIVDDFVGIGDVFKLVKNNILDIVQGPAEVRYATIFANPENINKNGYQEIFKSLSYAFSWNNDNILFPWEI
jgi:hypoxanthine phosphoribosyltransferase